jgi:hypothetical protein
MLSDGEPLQVREPELDGGRRHILGDQRVHSSNEVARAALSHERDLTPCSCLSETVYHIKPTTKAGEG